MTATAPLMAAAQVRLGFDARRGVLGRFVLTDQQRVSADENMRRYRRWRAAVGSLLQRRASLLAREFDRLATEWATFVALTCTSEGSFPIQRWRKQMLRRAREVARGLESIIERELSDEIKSDRPEECPELDLLIEPRSDLWLVRAHSPEGEATGTVQPPIRPPLTFPAELDVLMAIGRALFDRVFSAAVRSLYVNTTSRYERLRIRLWPGGSLADLPWESLHDGDDFLALNPRVLLSRGLKPLATARARTGPIRVLVTISDPEETDGLDFQEELQRLERVLAPLTSRRMLQLDVAPDGTLGSIRRRLRAAVKEGQPYHVWHFIGHGVEDQVSGVTELLMESAGESWPQRAGASLLRTLFNDHPELRMVVLNCCHAGRMVSDSAAASAFVQSGVPAIVAMRHEVSDDAAMTFCEELYGELVDGADIDEAVCEARRAIYFLPGGGGEWILPVLYLCGKHFGL